MWIEVLNTIVVDGRMFTQGETRDVDKRFLKAHGHEDKPTAGKKKAAPKNRVIYRQTVAPWDRQKVVDPIAETKKELEAARTDQSLMQTRLTELEGQLIATNNAINVVKPVLKMKIQRVKGLTEKLMELEREKEAAELEVQNAEELKDEPGTEAETEGKEEPAAEDDNNAEGQAASAGQKPAVPDKVTPKKKTAKKKSRNNKRSRSR